jgi:ankyrin repeat protein
MRQRIFPTAKFALVSAMMWITFLPLRFPDWLTGLPCANERLFTAIATNNFREFEAALAAGASPSDLTVADTLPLTDAAGVGHLEMTRRLIDAGVDVDAADRAGKTPLMAAAQHDHVEIVEFLIRCGANTWRRDSQNRTALDLATEGDCTRASQALRAATTRGI